VKRQADFRDQAKEGDAYNALFKVAKFSTVFGYARIDVSADKPARLRLDLRLRSHPAQELLRIGQEGEHRGAAPGCAARGGR